MELNQTEKLLIHGLKQFQMSVDDRLGVYILLKTDQQKEKMIKYLAANPDTTDQDILKKALEITEL